MLLWEDHQIGTMCSSLLRDCSNGKFEGMMVTTHILHGFLKFSESEQLNEDTMLGAVELQSRFKV